MNRTRGGQYELTLRRDVLADFNSEVETAPIYVEKGIINDISSPLLCNNESLQVNQIKTKEVLLKDKSASPWLCLYLKKGVLGTTNPGEQGIVHINVDEDDSGNNNGKNMLDLINKPNKFAKAGKEYSYSNKGKKK